LSAVRYNLSVVRDFAIILMAGASLWAADTPKTLISEAEAEPIHSAILRREAWTTDSVRRLRSLADRYLREGPWTVTADRPEGVALDPNEYYSEAPYYWPNPDNPRAPYIRREGQLNPKRFIDNRIALNNMADAVLTLGAAAFFLDDARYAQRAARVVQTWFINSRTRMNPTLDHAQTIRGATKGEVAGIVEGRALLRAIQGIEFLSDTPGWESRDRAVVRRWFEEYLEWLLRSKRAKEEMRSGNNRASWWAAQTAATANFVDNIKARDAAFSFYRERVLRGQIRPNGSAPREEARSRSLYNSVINLEAFTTVCRIAQVQGIDLWSLRAKGGASVATVVDYLAPYLSDPGRWAKERGSDYPADSLYFLAFAGMGLKKPEYVNLFQKLEHSDSGWQVLIDLMVSRWEASGHQTRH
jgi:hypothetical protein